jgi:hypothetical protein|tara:strand:+ start:1168 stop:1386 length:219 start_codon:yes stop_codon:yes gene_type:complete
MSLQEDLKALSNHEHFARFLQVISDLREETIEELHNADSKRIQQISGRILTYDQILQMSDWRTIRRRFTDQL